MMSLLLSKSNRALSGGPPPKKGAANAVVTFEAQCVIREKIFIWMRCNPLKSPDSDE